MSPPTDRPPHIGVFDSGVGGLSVLSALRQQLPNAEFDYVADSAHAPYGERSAAYVLERSRRIAAQLHDLGTDVLVIACNTATALAAKELRTLYPDWPIVGVEPGVKPAVAATRNCRIGVLATEGTLNSEKFALLAQAHAAHVELFLQPCPGLAAAIEQGDPDAASVRQRVAECCEPLKAADVDTVVLGCTHYPFVIHHIRQALGPQVTVIDTAEAVARRTASLCPPRGGAGGRTRLWTNGSIDALRTVATAWLPFPCEIQRWESTT